MHMSAVGKKALIAVSWKDVRLGACEGKPKEGTGTENHVLDVCVT